MTLNLRRAGVATVSLALFSAAGAAHGQTLEPAAAIAARKDGYREIGAAFKSLNDELRKPKPVAFTIQRSASTIIKTAPRIANWFPAGSGPAPGVKTRAEPAIWTKRTEFDAIQKKLLVNAAQLDKLAAAGDMKAVAAQVKVVGGDCKACHDKFRTPED